VKVGRVKIKNASFADGIKTISRYAKQYNNGK